MTASAMNAPAVASSVSNKIVVITGANAGLGFELSLRLACLGAQIVMACRNVQRAERARERVLGAVPAAKITVLPLDVAELESIRAFGTLLARQVGCLDILINNAAIFGVPLSRNSTGYELHIATNYLGPFALTGTLLPLVRERHIARIVNVGSLAHRFGKFCPHELDPKPGEYNAWRAYAGSKIALLTYTIELGRRLRERGSNILALCAHPGMAPTDIAKNSPRASRKTTIGKWFNKTMTRLIPTVAEAVEPILHAACADGVRSGDYYGPGGWLEIAGAPAKARLNALAWDEELARELWSISETLTGVRYLGAEAPCEARSHASYV